MGSVVEQVAASDSALGRGDQYEARRRVLVHKSMAADAEFPWKRDPTMYTHRREAAWRWQYGSVGGSEQTRPASPSGHSVTSSVATLSERADPPTSSSASMFLKDESIEGKRRRARSLGTAYAFGGIHHLFVEHVAAITSIRFANYNADLLGFASMDGKISITSVKRAPEVVHTLEGHTKGVLDFAWSASNEFILSCSEDRTLRLWNAETGECLRIIYEDAPSCCIAIHPINPNLFLAVGSSTSGVSRSAMELARGMDKAKGALSVYNMSTGKAVSKAGVEADPQSLCVNPEATFVFVGDARGVLHTYVAQGNNGKYVHKHKTVLCSGHPLTSVSYSAWSAGANVPSLLVNGMDGRIHLMRVRNNGSARETHHFLIVQRRHRVRSEFCPLISNRSGACIVTGSEDCNVYLFDSLAARDGTCVNKLQGHSQAVLDVAWNYDETLLASGDRDGLVILWKRQQTTNTAEGILDEPDEL